MTASAPLNLGLFRVHRIFSFAFFGFAILLLAISVSLQDQDALSLALTGLFFMAFGVAHWYGAKGAREGKAYGRFLSRVFGMLWLIGFPITTLLGIYVLSRAGSSWKEPPLLT